ncbi:uncharacterized protein LOC105801651 [Gossypium raimondii]|uniref:uncharacterized protein LOC105801651 n=1 Tax=Gossypium raimondii TaxID=29730 RepID=UPI00227D1A51|nr:uncharacterized protein LOC105801651 [Gossypium raimondii]
MEAPTQGSGNLMKNNTIRASNGYHLPTSNLPPQFRLDFSSRQMKMSLQEDPNLHFMDWMSLKEGNQHQDIGLPAASGSRSKFIMNKVYDPSYEAMGLPVDPHLRMFQAKYGNAAENKDKNKDKENEEHR